MKYYEILAESLVNKQNNLTEAFDSSIPDWVRNRLSRSLKSTHVRKITDFNAKPFNGNFRAGGEQIDYPNKAGSYKYDDTTSYRNPRQGNYGHNLTDMQKNIASQLLDKGISPDKIKFVDGEMPKSKVTIDRKLQDGLIPVWGFVNGQVYFNGINVLEQIDLVPWQIGQPNYDSLPSSAKDKQQTFEQMSIALLNKACNNFVWADISEASSNGLRDKIDKRLEYEYGIKDTIDNYGIDNSIRKRDAYNLPGIDTYGSVKHKFKDAESNYPIWDARVDKSGYLKPRNNEGLRKKLKDNIEKIRALRIPKLYKKYRDKYCSEIDALLNELSSLSYGADTRSFNKRYMESIDYAYTYIENALNNLSELMDKVISGDCDENDWFFKRNLRNIDSSINGAKTNITDAKGYNSSQGFFSTLE